jgi:hypothetical protein
MIYIVYFVNVVAAQGRDLKLGIWDSSPALLQMLITSW